MQHYCFTPDNTQNGHHYSCFKFTLCLRPDSSDQTDFAHVSWTSAANMTAFLHTPRVGFCITAALEDFKDPDLPHQTDGQARRLPDVNKHSCIWPSKGPAHCCGQRCLTCVMLDDVGGSALVVLMYSGAFHDLLQSCGRGASVQPQC